MLLFPTQYRRRKRPVKEIAPAAAASVTVLEVVRAESIDTLIWRFSSDVTLVGSVCPQLQADDGEGWRSPSSVEQTASNELTAFYEGETFDDSSPWQIVDAPAGVTFVDGTLIVPETGTVVL